MIRCGIIKKHKNPKMITLLRITNKATVTYAGGTAPYADEGGNLTPTGPGTTPPTSPVDGTSSLAVFTGASSSAPKFYKE